MYKTNVKNETITYILMFQQHKHFRKDCQWFRPLLCEYISLEVIIRSNPICNSCLTVLGARQPLLTYAIVCNLENLHILEVTKTTPGDPPISSRFFSVKTSAKARPKSSVTSINLRSVEVSNCLSKSSHTRSSRSSSKALRILVKLLQEKVRLNYGSNPSISRWICCSKMFFPFSLTVWQFSNLAAREKLYQDLF